MNKEYDCLQLTNKSSWMIILKKGLITLLVLAFWPTHENGPASFKLNKIVPKLSFFAVLVLPPIFKLQKRREMAVLGKFRPTPMLNHEINKE